MTEEENRTTSASSPFAQEKLPESIVVSHQSPSKTVPAIIFDENENEDFYHGTTMNPDDDAIDSEHTPCYAQRSSTEEYDRVTRETTADEISKLLHLLSPRSQRRHRRMIDHGTTEEPASNTTSVYVQTVLLVMLGLSLAFMITSFRPFCKSSGLSFLFPSCDPCPINANCDLFRVTSCKNENDTVFEKSICLPSRNESSRSLQLAHVLNSMIDSVCFYINFKFLQTAFRAKCLGALESIMMDDATLQNYIVALPNHMLQAGELYDRFREAKDILLNNPHLFRATVDTNGDLFSIRYDEVFSCLRSSEYAHYFVSNKIGNFWTRFTGLFKRQERPPVTVVDEQETAVKKPEEETGAIVKEASNTTTTENA